MSFKILAPTEKVLKRPARVIGDIKTTEHTKYTFRTDIKEESILYNPGLNKIIREIIDNSIDEFIRTAGEHANKIDINIADNTEIQVKDNGRGIPIKMISDPDGNEILIPEAAWTRIDAGSNFDDEEDNQTQGQNGEGAALTNIFSRSFKGETTNIDGKIHKTFILECTNNLSTTKTNIKDTKKPQGTLVTFTPDYERFNESNLPQGNIDVMNFDLLHIALTFPGIKFTLNSNLLKVRNLKEYAELYNSPYELIDVKGLKLVVMPNPSDNFKFVHFVNGLNVFNGGTPLNWVTDNIVSKIHEKLVKKYKSITKGDIKSKLFIVSLFNGIYNPRFADQIKSQCVNNFTDFKSQIDVPDFDKLVAKILRTPEIIDPITEVYRIKEEFKRRQELKAVDKKVNKKPKSEKFMPPIGDWTNCFLAEGDCLHEDTEIVLADGNTKKIKDVTIYDYVITADGTTQKIKSKVTSIRETVNITTKSGTIKCSPKHRFYVYDTSTKRFSFKIASDIIEQPSVYKMIKSKINEDTTYYNVNSNENNVLFLDAGEVTYTDNDFFITWVEGDFKRIHGSKIKKDMMILVN